MRPIGGLARDERGATTIVVALALTCLLSLASLGLNLAAIYLQSRRLQGAADLAALAAAQDIDRAQAAADAAVQANRFSSEVRAQVTLGVYAPLRDIAPASRFTPGASGSNAVRVRLSTRVPLIFGRLLIGRDDFEVVRVATAARADMASFSLGSRLASVQDGVANKLLSALAGGDVELSAMDYQALLDCHIGLFDYLDSLRTRLDLHGVSYDQILASDVTARDALGAMADTAEMQGADAAARALRLLSAAASPSLPAHLDRVFDLGDYGAQDHVAGGQGAKIGVRALDLAKAMLLLANGGRQVSTDLSAQAPGLAGVTLSLGIGEPAEGSAWLAVDGSGARTIHTAQSRLYLDAAVAPDLPILKLAGVVSIRAPLLVELASASARLQSADCTSPPGSRSASLTVQPSVGHVAIADIDVSRLASFDQPLAENPASLVQLAAIKASGKARVDLGGAQWQALRFSEDEVKSHTVKTADTRDLASASLSSLLSNLEVSVDAGGFSLGLGGLGLGDLDGPLKSAVQDAAAPLDGVLDEVTDFLGVHLGQADVTVNGLRCQQAALVS
jgi:uncharacterized membrane protein